MTYLWSLTIALVVSSHVPGGHDSTFIAWWKNYDDKIMVNENAAADQYRKKEELTFDSLPEYDGVMTKPGSISSDLGNVFTLYSQKNYTVLLVTPKKILNDVVMLNESSVQTIKKCEHDHSWIVTLPGNAWTPIDLNPYCAMDYGTDGIRISLYWTASATRPLIDIVTNSLACTPHQLYQWDGREQRYNFAANKCSGNKIIESYPLTGANLQQVF